MTLSSAGPLAPGDFISKGFLVSMAGCLGEWECGGGGWPLIPVGLG